MPSIRRIPVLSLLVLAAAALAACQGAPPEERATAESGPTPMVVKVPLGLELVPVPEDNPMTVEKVALGRQLYFDTRLSADNTVSCATCHDPARGWTDHAAVSTGIKGQQGGRSAPSVINASYNIFQFWDGRAASLEEQAVGPIQNPIEMGETHENVVKKLNAIEGYRTQFRQIFGTDVTIDAVGKAIAAFERTVVSGDSPYDRYQAGDKTALSEEAVRGLALFTGKAQCSQCHVGFNLSDGVFHNIGVGMQMEKPDLGRHDTTKEDKDRGAFKTPILRDLTKTAPYMHNGSEPTLETVVEYYNNGGFANDWLDPKMQPLNLTDQEKADLVAFMKALDGTFPVIAPPALP
jgi:cytochrome c peroxidase